jgi:hypothetical protein
MGMGMSGKILLKRERARNGILSACRMDSRGIRDQARGCGYGD